MIDVDDLRARPDAYQTAATHKGIKIDVQAFLNLDEKRRALIPEVDDMRATQNAASKKMPALDGDAKEKALAEMKKLSALLKEKEAELKEIEADWKRQQYQLPSIPLDAVPVGNDETENVEVRKEGTVSTVDFALKDHVELGTALDLIDIDRGVKVGGSRSYFLKGDGARLEQALLRYASDHLTQKGWTLFAPPLMVDYESVMGTGFLPGAEYNNFYRLGSSESEETPLESDELYLIATSEISVLNYHRGEVLQEADLPKRYAGISPCFRREAGSYGKDTHGLYRIHQFQKVEQVVLCPADEQIALGMFEEIRNNAEDVLKALELPYRIIDVCTGDMGKGKVFMQDIETWMPSRESYGETHSCSYLGDFQARRCGMKYETKDGEKKFVHTLNNTCIASPRILIPLLEIYQNKDGSITIPEVLRPYMNGQESISTSC